MSSSVATVSSVAVGALFIARGVPLTSAEAGPVPAVLVAITCTSYAVPAVRPVIVWLVPVAVASRVVL